MKNRIQTHLPSLRFFKSWLQFPALVMSATLPWLSPAFGDTVTFNTAGTTNWVCPPGVTTIQVECWGGGGAGGAANNTSTATSGTINVGGGGGAGGAYARKASVPVTPGLSYTITIPAAATRAAGSAEGTRTDGGSVTFTGDGAVVVTAVGGQGGASKVASTTSTGAGGVGSTTGCVGDVFFAGGSCTVGTSTGNAGGGGGGAGDANPGGNTGSNVGGAGGVSGGGAGGTGPTGSNNGGAGVTPGGGGSGGRMQRLNGSARAGGAGGRGQIVLTYTVPANYKANNEDLLKDASSWTLGVPAGTLAIWQNTVPGPNTTSLGADLTFSGIQVLDPGGLVTINSGNTLTLGSATTDIDLSIATQDLTLNCNVAMNAANVWDVDASRTLTIGGAVSGAFGVTKQGLGTALLMGANTWTGSTAVTGGTLKLGASSVIPDGTGTGNVTVDGALDLNGYNEAINGLSGIGVVDNTAASTVSTITVGANNATSSFSGILQNTGSAASLRLTKTGSGNLTLTGPNTYAGTTTVNGGALNIQDSSALGTTAAGTDVNGGATGATSTARLELQGGITVTGEPVTIKGVGNFIGALSSFSGSNEWAGNVTIGSSSTRIGASAGASLRVSGVIDSGSNPYGLIIRTTDLTGSVILSGANTYLGDTTNLIGKLQLDGGDNRLPVTGRFIAGSGAFFSELDLNGRNQEVAGLGITSGATAANNTITNASLTLSTLTVNTAASASTFAGILSGNLALTKSGAEALTLAGANTYTGATNVTAGTLLFSSAGSGVSDVTVSSSASAGALVAATDGQFVSTGDLAMNNSSVITIDYGSTSPSTTVAPLKVDNFTVGNGLSLLIRGSNLSGLTVSQSYPLVTWTTSGPVDGSAFTAVLNQRIQGTFSVTGNTLFLTVTSNTSGSPISWNTGNGTWDTTSSNWIIGALATTFINVEDAVLFGDAAGATGDPLITLNSAFSPTSVTMNSASHDYTISGTGGIGGNASLTLDAANSRTLTLATANTYTGTTAINGGTLRLGTGGIDGSLAATGTITIGTGATFAVNQSDTVTQGTDFSSAAISGAGGFAQTGTGTTILNVANTYSGPTTISGGILQIAGAGQLGGGTYAGDIALGTGASLQYSSTAAQTLSGIISGNGSLNKTSGSGAITLSGANTYTGSTTINGTLSLANVDALSTTTAITLSGGATLSTTTDAVVVNAPITLGIAASNSNIAFSRSTSAAGTLTLNGAIGGAGNLIFTTPDVSSAGNIQTILLGGAGTYAGTTTITTGNTGNTVSVKATVANALPVTTVLNLTGGDGSGSGRTVTYDLNGNNQTLAGLTNSISALTARNHRVTNSSVTSATLTINNTTDYTYGGTGISSTFNGNPVNPTAQITGSLALTKTGPGKFTLASGSGNTFTGATTILGGILRLGQATSLQNSPLDTLNSVVGDAANGLQASTITLTLGGLTGNKDLASVFTTTSGGYGSVTTLTLNTFTGATTSYSGIIADGATGMNLTKSGAGTQTLSGSNTYTGATTVSVGKLLIDGNQTSASGAVAVSGGATLGGTGIIGGSTTIADTGKLEFNLSTAPGSHDKLELASGKTLAFTASSTLTITSSGGATTGTYTLFTAPGGITGSVPATVVLPVGWTADPPAITGVGNTDLVINITSVGAGAPEIAVEQPAATDIPNGGSQGFGTVTIGSNTSLTFTIRNTGTDPLNLTGSPLVAVSGTNAADFTVTAVPTTPVTSGGGTTTFTVQFAPGAAGARSAVLTIANNDSDEGSFTINVNGTGQTAYDAWSGGAAFNADANGDGVKNGLAWILGAANPSASALGLLPTVSTGSGNMFFAFKRNQASINANTALTIEVGNNLSTWTTYNVGADTAGSSAGITVAKDTPSAGTDTVTLSVTQSPDAKKFARLKATQTP